MNPSAAAVPPSTHASDPSDSSPTPTAVWRERATVTLLSAFVIALVYLYWTA